MHKSNPATHSLREHLGVTELEVLSRLDLVGIGPADIDALTFSRPFVVDHVDELVDEFYRRPTAVDEIAVIIGDADSLRRLQRAMRKYILDIFAAEFDTPYVNSRLRIGMVHKRIGVSPKLYLSSVRILTDVLRETFDEHGSRQRTIDTTAAIDAFDKVLHFDSALVFDAYLRSLMNELDTAWARSEDHARDVERRLAERTRHLEAATRRDPLTGAANRRGLLEALSSALSLAFVDGTPVSVRYADIDDFNAVNDEHGHATGDRVLRLVGGALRQACRDGDTIARLGGDEFCAVLTDCDLDHAVEVAERLFSHLEASGEGITLSVGLTQSSALTSTDGEALMARADARMYEAKQKPGNAIST